ncbi:hypothetical protein Poli38472_013423 [Pythium oligandrum]|uniref:Uncharacterized protein n=1 Tax=Pythium oligandrum TaxID=41045 RepID=A0A8K1C7M8_PYTOL|nr:hypothetical protein Poli38472_013423 [Pythium oligandrum]|eukprot:TMW57949.1 hypothetical protein Poli38472_013423 [Pythium oligandrum]
MWKDVATRRVTASERDLPTNTTKTWWHAERRVSAASSAAIAGEIDAETRAGDTQEATPRDERMTASIARSSSSSKTKFSSRNLNAVYKAPVSKSSESAGFPSANRMLVLRPVRGAVGVAKANTVAAPTPINTPSLRKENMGQDIHVNLVPSGRNGWGNEKNDEKSTEERRPSEPHEASEHQSSGENVWNGGVHSAPTTTLSQPSGNSAAIIVIIASVLDRDPDGVLIRVDSVRAVCGACRCDRVAHQSSKETKMALSIRAKNFIMGSSLGAFAFGVFAYTVQQMSKDDFAELDEVAKVNVHQSGAIKATPIKKSE